MCYQYADDIKAWLETSSSEAMRATSDRKTWRELVHSLDHNRTCYYMCCFRALSLIPNLDVAFPFNGASLRKEDISFSQSFRQRIWNRREPHPKTWTWMSDNFAYKALWLINSRADKAARRVVARISAYLQVTLRLGKAGHTNAKKKDQRSMTQRKSLPLQGFLCDVKCIPSLGWNRIKYSTHKVSRSS